MLIIILAINILFSIFCKVCHLNRYPQSILSIVVPVTIYSIDDLVLSILDRSIHIPVFNFTINDLNTFNICRNECVK